MIYLVFLLFLLAGGGLAVLTWQNLTTTIQLTFWQWTSPAISIGLLLLGAFLLGSLIFYLLNVAAARRDKKTIRELQLRIDGLQQQVQQQSNGMKSEQTMTMQPTTPIIKMPGMSGPLHL